VLLNLHDPNAKAQPKLLGPSISLGLVFIYAGLAAPQRAA
jgi:hypothetical protein